MRRLLLLPAIALVLVGAPVLALEQPSSGSPDTTATPAVTEVPLPAAQSTTVEPGFEQQIAVDASVVGVTWDGDPSAEFSVETRDGAGRWQPAVEVEADDTQPDAGSPDASSSAAARQATEPIWVKDATAVRVRLENGTASNVKISAVDSTPETPQPATATAPAEPQAQLPSTAVPSTTPSSTTPSSTTPPSTTQPSTTPPAGDGSQVAPPGSAGAATGWLVPVDGPARYAYAGALLATALLLAAIALGWSPWRRRRVRRVALLVVAAALLATACRPVVAPAPPPPPPSATNGGTQPSIVMRSTWKAASPSCTDYTSPMTFAVVHHTVNSNNYTASESAQILRSIQAYHMNTLGYCDIAYNFLIDKYGQIFEGRGGGIDEAVLGAHTGGFNSKSTGVALIGDYRTARISPAQWAALVHLLQWKLSIHGSDATSPFTTTSNGGGSRYPAGQSVTFSSRILGHTDLWPTECPGANVMSELPTLRQQVQSGVVAPPTTTTTTTTTTSTPPTT